MNTNVHKNGVHFMKMTYNSILFGGEKNQIITSKLLQLCAMVRIFFKHFGIMNSKLVKKHLLQIT